MSLTLMLVILTCIISYTSLQDRSRQAALLHSPYQEKRSKQFYRFLTAGFVHGSLGHLGINMFVLYMFGEIIESRFLFTFGEMMGRINFLMLYLLGIIFANIPTFLTHNDNPHFSSVGASGAVSGIVFVFILFYPWEMLYLFLVIPCPAIVAGILYLAYSSYAAKKGGDNIDHLAHFGGAIFGIVFACILKPSLFGQFLQDLVQKAPF